MGDLAQELDTSDLWAALIQRIDYHHGKWYLYTDDEWTEAGVGAAIVAIDKIAPNKQDDIIRLFRLRDSDARARLKA